MAGSIPADVRIQSMCFHVSLLKIRFTWVAPTPNFETDLLKRDLPLQAPDFPNIINRQLGIRTGLTSRKCAMVDAICGILSISSPFQMVWRNTASMTLAANMRGDRLVCGFLPMSKDAHQRMSIDVLSLVGRLSISESTGPMPSSTTEGPYEAIFSIVIFMLLKPFESGPKLSKEGLMDLHAFST